VSYGLAIKNAQKSKILLRRHFLGRKVLSLLRFVVLFDARGRSFPEPLCQKGCFLAAVVLEPLWVASGILENQGAAIAQFVNLSVSLFLYDGKMG
jgi:hypothetical protein